LAFYSGREGDHSPPSSAEVKEWVELYLHSPNTPSWRGARLGGAQGLFFYLHLCYENVEPYFTFAPHLTRLSALAVPITALGLLCKLVSLLTSCHALFETFLKAEHLSAWH
jgi:hypothetical protein